MKTASIRRLVLATAAALLALAPGRAAADPASVFVSNFNNGTDAYVSAYSATGAAATGPNPAPTGFSDPQGLAYDPANNTLYVADSGTNQIRTFNATSGAETTSASGFANATGLSGPAGLAYSTGTLYAANQSANTVTAYSTANGAPVTGFTSPAGLSYPSGLAVGGTTLFVANPGTNTLGAYNLASTTTAAAAGFAPITGLSTPYGVALFGNDLFVANFGNGTVGEYNASSGQAINADFVTGLDGPFGLAVLGDRLLVANQGSAGTGTTVGAYGIPDVATNGNVPTTSDASFLTGLDEPEFIAVVPEPGTWMLPALLTGALALAAGCRRAGRIP